MGSTIALGFGDIQLANGVAFSISALTLMQTNRFSVYHYDIVCCLGLAATFTSAATMFSRTPYIHLETWVSGARLLLFFLSAGLLHMLLSMRWEKRGSFPGRAPSSNTQKYSALVLQTLCLFNEKIPPECLFSTDRVAILFMSDIWVFLILAIVICLKIYSENNWRGLRIYYKIGERNIDRRKLPWDVQGVEILGVLISAVWTGVALWQCFNLRRWMNNSGWLKDDKEKVANSFGTLFTLFSILSLILLLATAFDCKCTF